MVRKKLSFEKSVGQQLTCYWTSNSQAQKTVFEHISKQGEVFRNNDMQQIIFWELYGVWKCGQTWSWVFLGADLLNQN